MTAPRFRGKPFELGGTNYIVPPLSLGAIEEFESRIAEFERLPVIDQVRFVVDLAHRALSRNYPELKRHELAELIDMHNAFQLFAAILQESGLVRVEGDPDPNPRASASGGTGSPSTPT